MPAIVDAAKCSQCGDCVESCPTDAITQEGENPAVVNAEECSDCGVCVDECPEEAITLEE